ncbi:putative metal-dependent hydrolase [Salibacterium salarium]|uniref:DUF309 domain-containing protein n=1 Tax=Salibacterium salarium TaxID=284579 RepID=UPI0027884DF5|nr:DUF309 domain-containing protein [Salibacterium salarium]MDQ0299511.1 putative metal-dependent hydrolase [Salibacterium salarium]
MYPDSYIEYLIQFHSYRDFFECHEILEEHWKENDITNRNSPWVGLIQVAVGLYHHRRENFRGAEKILKSAYSILEKNSEHIQQLGINYSEFLTLVNDRIAAIQADKDYVDINLPLTDHDLIDQCKKESIKQNVPWIAASDMTNKHLIHRHILRDRTEIDEERLHQKQMKRKTTPRK